MHTTGRQHERIRTCLKQNEFAFFINPPFSTKKMTRTVDMNKSWCKFNIPMRKWCVNPSTPRPERLALLRVDNTFGKVIIVKASGFKVLRIQGFE